jgi:hypothetical protein
MNSPRCEDLKTVALHLEETFLFGADLFRVPRNVHCGNPFISFQAIRAGVRNQRVQQFSTFLHSFRWLPFSSRQEEKRSGLGKDCVSGGVVSHNRLFLACGLNLGFERNQSPFSENFGAVVTTVCHARDGD